jgi:hypothetical protein
MCRGIQFHWGILQNNKVAPEDLYLATSEDIQGLVAQGRTITESEARSAYHLWLDNPHHPSLQFKQIHSTGPINSVMIIWAHVHWGFSKMKGWSGFG